MKQASEIQVEDMITVLMRRDDPDIERIGAQEAKDGWRCYWVWVLNDAPRLTKKERDEVLAKANLILADLRTHRQNQEAVPHEGLTTSRAAPSILAGWLGPLQS